MAEHYMPRARSSRLVVRELTPVMAQSPCTETSCPPGTTCQAGVCEPEGA